MEITFQYLLKDKLYSLKFFYELLKISAIYFIAILNFFKLFKSYCEGVPFFFTKFLPFNKKFLPFNKKLLSFSKKLLSFKKFLQLFPHKTISTNKNIFLHIFLLRYLPFFARIVNLSPLLYFYTMFLTCTETLGLAILLWCNLLKNKGSRLKSELISRITKHRSNPSQLLLLTIVLVCYLMVIFYSYFLLLLGKLPDIPVLGPSAKALTFGYVKYKLTKRKFKLRLL